MTDFFTMGGYAAYIWPAYGVAAMMMLTLLVASLRGLKEREATLKGLEGSRPPRRRERRAAAPSERTVAEPTAI